MLNGDCCKQLEELKSECSDKDNTVSQLRKQLSKNSAKLDSLQQEYGVYITVDLCCTSTAQHQPSQAFRSSTQQLLQVPYMSTDFGQCVFQLQLSCNTEFHSYLHQKSFVPI